MARRTFSRQTTPFADRVLRALGLYVMPAAICLSLIIGLSWLSSVSPMARDMQARILHHMEPVITLTQGPVSVLKDKYEAFVTLQNDADTLATLRRENEELKHWIQVAQMMGAENKALKNLMNVEHDESLGFTTAKIVMDQNSSYAHTVLVRADKGHSIRKGQAALVEKGLIGRIVDVGDEYARIMLLRDMNSRIPVVVEHTGDKAILSGTNKSLPVLEHLSPYHMVEEGQKVITSGHGGALPYGIAVGETMLDEEGNMAVKLYADSVNSSFVKIIDYGLTPSMAGGSYAASTFPNIH